MKNTQFVNYMPD